MEIRLKYCFISISRISFWMRVSEVGKGFAICSKQHPCYYNRSNRLKPFGLTFIWLFPLNSFKTSKYGLKRQEIIKHMKQFETAVHYPQSMPYCENIVDTYQEDLVLLQAKEILQLPI